jgi:hypothetical protein
MLEVFFVTGFSVVGIAFPIITVFILQHYVFQHFLERKLSVFHVSFRMRIISQNLVYARFSNKKRGGKI